MRYVAAGVLALLSLADVVLTRQVLMLGGEELNPIADAFIRTPSAWALKGIAVVVIAFVTAYFMRSRWLIRSFYIVLAIYAAVVAMNALNLVALA